MDVVVCLCPFDNVHKTALKSFVYIIYIYHNYVTVPRQYQTALFIAQDQSSLLISREANCSRT